MNEVVRRRSIEKRGPGGVEETATRSASTEDARQAQVLLPVDVPLPSGKLHMGHVRNYTIGDVLTRYHRMRGYNVLQPMGWDAFGLPAENAAMANGVPPAKWTYDNIAYMKRSCSRWASPSTGRASSPPASRSTTAGTSGCSCACSKKGLAYKKTGVVNWDPVDQTVLANEQVIDGRGWRTGALVEKREIPMYYLRITRYAEELLEALEQLPGWPERVKPMQANWIGRSKACEFAFPYDRTASRKSAEGVHHPRRHAHGRDLRRRRCRASTRGARCEGQSRSSPRSSRSASGRRVRRPSSRQMEKKGMPTGLFVSSSAYRRAVAGVGRQLRADGLRRGRGDGVPAHDERDFEFAKQIRPADQAGDPAPLTEERPTELPRNGRPTPTYGRSDQFRASTTA